MTQRGTHQGTLFGGPPTGKHIIAAGIAVFRLKERQIVEEWLITDQLGMM
jgi:predicted ester cyclase